MSTLLLVVGVIVGFAYIYHHVVVKGKRCASKARLDGKTVIVTDYRHFRVLFTSEGRMECEMDQRFVICSDAGTPRTVVVKSELSQKAKLSIYWPIYVPTLTYGSNTGIGKTTAIDLAKRGARVILACRSKQRGEAALEDIKRESGSNQVVFMQLDLGSLKSVRSFAENFLKSELRLDILINNAGIYLQGRTEDGLGMMFGVNHIGHFLLTNLLLDRLKECEPSRVVNVSSVAHCFGKIDFDCLNTNKALGLGTSFMEVLQVYSNSKLCNVLFTHELAKRLQGTKVTCYSLHPGAINSELARNTSSVLQLVLTPLTAFFFKNTIQGSQTTLHCAVQEGIEHLSGRYFSNCTVREVYPKAKDDAMAKKLWELSERLCGLA